MNKETQALRDTLDQMYLIHIYKGAEYTVFSSVIEHSQDRSR